MDAGAAAAAAAGRARGLPEPPGALPVRPGTRGPGAGGGGRPRLPSPGAEAAAALLRQIRRRRGLRECGLRAGGGGGGGGGGAGARRGAEPPSEGRREPTGTPAGRTDVGVVGGGAGRGARGLPALADPPPPPGGRGLRAWPRPPEERAGVGSSPRPRGLARALPDRETQASRDPGAPGGVSPPAAVGGTAAGKPGLGSPPSWACGDRTRPGRSPARARSLRRAEAGAGSRAARGPWDFRGRGAGNDRGSRRLRADPGPAPAASPLPAELVSVQSFGLGKRGDPEVQCPVAERCHRGGPRRERARGAFSSSEASRDWPGPGTLSPR